MKSSCLLYGVLFSFLLWSCDTTKKSVGDASNQNSSATYQTVVMNADIPSPRKEMRGKLGSTSVTINYGSPSAKGRTLWGGLVPNGEVWRTGANEATTIEFSKAVKIEGQALPAGKYGLFTIPSKDNWSIVFNKTSDQWGAYNYNESMDALRVNVPTKMVDDFSETMDFMMEGNSVVLKWGKKRVAFKVTS